MIVGIALCLGFIAYTFVHFLDKSASKKYKHWEYTRLAKPPEVEKEDIIYQGRQNSILFEEVHDILLNHCAYFVSLDPGLKQVFIERLLSFMEKKTFIIKDDEGFKEMPEFITRQVTVKHSHFFALVLVGTFGISYPDNGMP